MNWQEICDNPQLRDLPFKLETDRWGHIVMSPASNRHSLVQGLAVWAGWCHAFFQQPYAAGAKRAGAGLSGQGGAAISL